MYDRYSPFLNFINGQSTELHRTYTCTTFLKSYKDYYFYLIYW